LTAYRNPEKSKRKHKQTKFIVFDTTNNYLVVYSDNIKY